MSISSIEFVVHVFSSIWFVIMTLALHILGKNSDTMKGNSDNNEGVFHKENWFQSFLWQYQGGLLTKV